MKTSYNRVKPLSMEECRNIMRHGYATQSFSLPHKWCNTCVVIDLAIDLEFNLEFNLVLCAQMKLKFAAMGYGG